MGGLALLGDVRSASRAAGDNQTRGVGNGMLEDGYGVLAGTLTAHQRDTPNNQGRWFHVKLSVAAGGSTFECAVDVDSKQSNVGVMWKTAILRPNEWAAITGLSPGFHLLRVGGAPGPGVPDGKALDYMRDARFQNSPGCVFVMMPSPFIAWLNNLFRRTIPPWQSGNNAQAATALEGLLAVGQRIWVFGEPFTSGLGLHNIHQNQGDPLNSPWAAENGIWQDGATIVELSDGRLAAFLNKFSTQSDRTDQDGHPA